MATAKAMALHAIEDIRTEALDLGAAWQGWQLDIVAASGQALASMPLDPTHHCRRTEPQTL